jgi:phospholipid transport system substrate-binding protein
MLMAAAAFAVVSAKAAQPAARDADLAIDLVERTGTQLIAIAASDDSAREKRRRLAEIVDSSIDIDDIGRFCLGRFWSSATLGQQALFLAQFRELLITKLAAYLPVYRNVTHIVGSASPVKNMQIVAGIVLRHDHSVMLVNWVVGNSAGGPRIVDVQAEGTSLRVTQRDDFISFLSHHDNSIDQLNDGMGKLVALNP